jgi:hypothetical protein
LAAQNRCAAKADGWLERARLAGLHAAPQLNQAGVLSASDVANEVAAAIRSRLPPQVRREQLGRFLQFALPVIPVFFEPHQSSAWYGQ